jgi:hypothetical protein
MAELEDAGKVPYAEWDCRARTTQAKGGSGKFQVD